VYSLTKGKFPDAKSKYVWLVLYYKASAEAQSEGDDLKEKMIKVANESHTYVRGSRQCLIPSPCSLSLSLPTSSRAR
jgi:hypothetical protein